MDIRFDQNVKTMRHTHEAYASDDDDDSSSPFSSTHTRVIDSGSVYHRHFHQDMHSSEPLLRSSTHPSEHVNGTGTGPGTHTQQPLRQQQLLSEQQTDTGNSQSNDTNSSASSSASASTTSKSVHTHSHRMSGTGSEPWLESWLPECLRRIVSNAGWYVLLNQFIFLLTGVTNTLFQQMIVYQGAAHKCMFIVCLCV
jgi:hypothetical protein